MVHRDVNFKIEEAKLAEEKKNNLKCKLTMSNITSAIPPPNSIWNGTEVPTDTPTSLLPSPVDTNYYAPSKSQILMYIVIVSIIIALIAFLSRCVRMLISFLITFLAECHFLNIFSLCT